MLITDQAAIMNTPIDSSHKNLHLGLLFHLANQFKDLLIGHYFADSGITAPQFKVLINIFKGNTSPAEICKSLQMDTGAMSRMVARMVKNDLIERRPNPHDKRQVILALTAKGQTLCNTFQNEMRAQFNTDVDFRTIASVQMFMGIGVAFFFMPLTTIVLSNLHGNEVAEGSGLATFFRVLGGSFASSLTTWIWQRREVFHHANLTESVTQYNPAAMDYVNKMGGPTQQHLAMIDQVVTQQAYMMSTIDYFWVLGWGFMALIIIIWFTRPPFVKSGMPGAPAAGH